MVTGSGRFDNRRGNGADRRAVAPEWLTSRGEAGRIRDPVSARRVRWRAGTRQSDRGGLSDGHPHLVAGRRTGAIPTNIADIAGLFARGGSR